MGQNANTGSSAEDLRGSMRGAERNDKCPEAGLGSIGVTGCTGGWVDLGATLYTALSGKGS
jgi:hypothetical protein